MRWRDRLFWLFLALLLSAALTLLAVTTLCPEQRQTMKAFGERMLERYEF
jgi:hypothetical protein